MFHKTHIHIIKSDCNNIVRIVCKTGCNSTTLQSIILQKSYGKMSGGMMPFQNCNFAQITTLQFILYSFSRNFRLLCYYLTINNFNNWVTLTFIFGQNKLVRFQFSYLNRVFISSGSFVIFGRSPICYINAALKNAVDFKIV